MDELTKILPLFENLFSERMRRERELESKVNQLAEKLKERYDYCFKRDAIFFLVKEYGCSPREAIQAYNIAYEG